MIQISVVICTYNRANLLTKALERLVQQSLPPQYYEIIVVDNASTDETPEVVRIFRERYTKHTIIRLYESNQGIGYARNTGWKHARGRYIAYSDDDALVSADWLKIALELFETVQPTPVCVGGPILPFYTTPKPRWFKDEYAIRTWGDKPRYLGRDESFSGPNMVWRREIIEAFGGFEVKVGVKGNYLSLGEETALFHKVWRSTDTPVFFYSPQLVVHHWVLPFKMKVSYQLKRAFVAGQVWVQLYGPKAFQNRLRFFIRSLFSMAKEIALAIYRGYVYHNWGNWLVDEWRTVAFKVGALTRTCGLIISVRQE